MLCWPGAEHVEHWIRVTMINMAVMKEREGNNAEEESATIQPDG